MNSRFRLLPIFICIATIMLTLKAGSIWFEIGKLEGGIEVQTAHAQETPQAGPTFQSRKMKKKRNKRYRQNQQEKSRKRFHSLEFSRSEVLIFKSSRSVAKYWILGATN